MESVTPIPIYFCEFTKNLSEYIVFILEVKILELPIVNIFWILRFSIILDPWIFNSDCDVEVPIPTLLKILTFSVLEFHNIPSLKIYWPNKIIL